MTSTASTILRLELMGDGDQPGNWGDTTNTNLGTLLEGSIAGVSNVSVTASPQALSAVNYATDESRMAILILTTTTAANFAVYAPGNNTLTPSPISKTYAIYNNTSYTATIYNSTSTGNTTPAGTGVDLAAGEKAYVFSDGKSFYKASPATLSLSLGTAAAPSLSFIGDANTGIYSAGAEQLNITSNGVRTAAFNSGTFDVYAVNSVSSISARNIYTNAAGSFFNFYKANNGGSGTEAIVANSDTLGTVRFLGYDGSAYRSGAEISAVVDGTPGASDMPGRLTFSTTADGASSVTERMRIDNAGNVGVNTASPSTYGKLVTYNSDGNNGFVVVADTSALRMRGYSSASAGATVEATTANLAAYAMLTVGGSSVNIATGGVGRLTIDSSGNATFAGSITATGSVTATGGFNSAPASVDSVGSVIAAYYAVANTTATGSPTLPISIGSTVSGSDLRYNPTVAGYSSSLSGGEFSAYAYAYNTTSWTAGGTALSGTWRCMGRPGNWKQDDGAGGFNYYYFAGLWVRIS